jgi:hypothetical protein
MRTQHQVRQLQAQQQGQQQLSGSRQPWYSLLTCRLLGFMGGGEEAASGQQPNQDLAAIRGPCARPVVSSHRLSADRRTSVSSIASIRCESPLLSWHAFEARQPPCTLYKFISSGSWLWNHTWSTHCMQL